jgi:hypothetical protein
MRPGRNFGTEREGGLYFQEDAAGADAEWGKVEAVLAAADQTKIAFGSLAVRIDTIVDIFAPVPQMMRYLLPRLRRHGCPH